MTTFSPSSPPTAAMFGLGAPVAFIPAIAAADWSLELDSTAGGAAGAGIGNVVQGLDDIEQCIVIILSTPKGSDPLRPTFACDVWRYLDRPITQTPQIVREVTEALTIWEPRITVVSVAVSLDAASLGRVVVTITWRLNVTGAPAQATTITLPPAGGNL